MKQKTRTTHKSIFSNQCRRFMGGPALVKQDGSEEASKHIAGKKHRVSLGEERCKHRMRSKFQCRPEECGVTPTLQLCNPGQ